MDTGFKAPLKPNPQSSANILSASTFFWTLPIFKKGYKDELVEADLYQPLPSHDSGVVGAKLENIWFDIQKKASSENKTPSLLKALIRCFGKKFILVGLFLAVMELVVRISQPILLGWLISYFSPGSTEDRANGYYYAAGVVLCSAICTWVGHPYMFAVMHIGMQMRVATCSLAYRKILRLNQSALKVTTPGQMVNLLSNDVNRFDLATIFMHYLWIGPLQLLLITIVLAQYIGYISSLVGIATLLLYIPLQGYLGRKSSHFRLKVAVRTDERVRLMNEIISAIQVIKMYAWEIPFQKMVSLSRKREMQQVTRSNYIRALTLSLIVFAMRFAIFMTVVSFVMGGGAVNAEKVFIITAFFNILRPNMTVFFPQGISLLCEGLVSVKRLQNVMLLQEVESSSESSINVKEGHVALKNAWAKWDTSQSEYTLNNINMDIPPGKLAAIIGQVGAGKSSILQTIMKELSLEKGSLKLGGKVSYAAQEPWLFAGTVRQNILFGEAMDAQRYRDVVQVCALRTDLAILPQGDRTLVGERGVTLSGGQRARISLARAVYRNADIYLFDDPLSAVDAHVSAHLFNDCIKTYLAGKTRILVTHQLQYVQDVDDIFILSNGHLEAHGSYADLRKSGLDTLMSSISLDSEKSSDQLAGKQDSPFKQSSGELHRRASQNSETRITASPGRDSKRSSYASTQFEFEPTIEPEARAQGAVGWSVVKSYFGAAGNCCYIFLVFFMFALTQILASASDYWLTLWVEVEQENFKAMENPNHTADSVDKDTTVPWYEKWPPDHDVCTYIYGAIAVATIVSTLCRSFLFFQMCVRASRGLHDRMFASITYAKMKFFNNNTSGRILNRFSKDIGSIDEIMPSCIIDTFQIGLQLFSVMILVCVVNYWLMMPILVVSALSVLLRVVFMSTSRSIKRLEGVTRSPVFSYMNASLNGISTIRALHMETKLIAEFDSHQDLHSSAWYLFLATNRAFGYYLDQLCVIFITAVTFSFLVGSQLGVFGGNVGLAITQAISLTGMVQWGMRQEAEVENHMASVERVIEYSNLPAESSQQSAPEIESHRTPSETVNDYSTVPAEVSPEPVQVCKPDAAWPREGRIQFNEVFLSYESDDPPVLKNLNFTIEPQEKVGIVGRTGAGKSSLIAALFRLEEVRGCIAIDGFNTKAVGLHDLRRKLSIIPQEPVLFNGTMRKNLDPFDENSDEVLWSALQEVELKDVVEGTGHGLEFLIHEGGSNLSVGQRQLVCLARAIVRNNKILILDEATANVDHQTDALIQHMIREKFRNCTVLTIAHRLNTIMDSDKVLVMDAGTMVEFDHPHVLLQNKSGFLYKMVEQVGGHASKKLQQVAKESYERLRRQQQDS